MTPYRLPTETMWLLNDPALIQQTLGGQEIHFSKWAFHPSFRRTFGTGLLNSEGERHRLTRRVVGPGFRPRRLADYAREMTDRTMARLASWPEDGPVELDHETTILTLDIAARTLFGVALETGSLDEVVAASKAAISLSDRCGVGGADDRVFDASVERLNTVCRLILDTRRREGQADETLLALLIQAGEADAAPTWFGDEQIVEELRNFLLAGHATTALVLAAACWHLAGQPEVQTDLQRHLDTALGDRTPSIEDLPALAPCEHILLEALRLHPPSWVLGREARDETRLGEYLLPAGTKVIVVPWLLHRDPVRFPAPEEFRPNRWRGDARERLPRGSFLPFSVGSRSCLGERFAMLEGTLLLASLLRGWRFARIPGQADPGWTAKLILWPQRGVRLRATRRPATF